MNGSNPPKQYKPNGYWNNKNRCCVEAEKYSNRTEFSKGSNGAYASAVKHGWLDEITAHYCPKQKHRGHWNDKDNCRIEAEKYSNKTEFRKVGRGAYSSAEKHGWLDEITAHYCQKQKPNGYWTIDKCQQEAKKFSTRIEFQKLSGAAYSAARKKGWLDDICKHMEHVGNKKLRCIYIAKFENRTCYIGLTADFNRRTTEHLSGKSSFRKGKTKDSVDNSAVFLHMKESGEVPIVEQLTKYISSDKAAKKEQQIIEHYELKGWTLLNRIKGGSLGSSTLKWDLEALTKEAQKYQTRTEFMIGSSGAYSSASKQNMLDQICTHMVSPNKPLGYWTKKKCEEEAKKYNSRRSFSVLSASAYRIAIKNEWLDDICKHMTSSTKPLRYWNDKDNCRIEAEKYSNRTDFRKGGRGAYASAEKHGWLDEITSHYCQKQKPNGYWKNKDNCLSEAKKYDSRTEFQKGSHGAYASASRHGWLEEITAHYPIVQKPLGYWKSKENCAKEAMKYDSKKDFSEGSNSAYVSAHKYGWLDEITSHMVSIIKPKGYWTKGACRAAATLYESKSEFRQSRPEVYAAATKNDWMNDVCEGLIQRSKKPGGYWTQETCHQEALKYRKKEEFKKGSGGAYRKSLDHGWLDTICSHMF